MSAGLVELGAGPTGALVALVRAQDPAPPPGEGPEFGEASPIALLITILLGIALIFLLRSMTKHLKRVPVSFEAPEERAPVEAAERVEPSEPSVAAEGTEPVGQVGSADPAERAERTD